MASDSQLLVIFKLHSTALHVVRQYQSMPVLGSAPDRQRPSDSYSYSDDKDRDRDSNETATMGLVHCDPKSQCM
eukprot:3941222-Rhodomonas_salina.5